MLPVDTFFNLGQFFTNEPLRAFAIALLFLAFAVSDRWMAGFVTGVKPWVQLVPAAGWILFAINEEDMRAAAATHRFDIAITLPVLAVLTAIGVFAWIGNVRRAIRAKRATNARGPSDD
jgi:hypothetical protein